MLVSLEAQKKEIQEVNDGIVLPNISWKQYISVRKPADHFSGRYSLEVKSIDFRLPGLESWFQHLLAIGIWAVQWTECKDLNPGVRVFRGGRL